MHYLPFILLGIFPSFIWLLYFLTKDRQPEPRLMIITVFGLGIVGARVAVFLEPIVRNYLSSLEFLVGSQGVAFLKVFLGVALIEEFVKLLAILIGVYLINIKELDEPVDFLIYMVTAGLGFAVLENIIYFSQAPMETFAVIVFLRFAITTLFHGLVAAILGYFLAYGNYRLNKLIMLGGFITVTFLHTLFNTLLAILGQMQEPIYVFLFLSFFVVLISITLKIFNKTKKMKAICRLN